MASPVTLVPKKDNTTRFCVDYHKLNAETFKNIYPLLLMHAIFDEMGGIKIFSTIDLKLGFWQIAVAPEDQAKTALDVILDFLSVNDAILDYVMPLLYFNEQWTRYWLG